MGSRLREWVKDARATWSKCDDGTAHIWDQPNRKLALIPVCMFCGITTLGAQQEQPATKGAGPCAKRAWLRAMPINETPVRVARSNQ